MTRGKQKIEAQRKNAEKNQKSKGSQLEARAVGLKVICPICKVKFSNTPFSFSQICLFICYVDGFIGRVSLVHCNLDLSLLFYSLMGDIVGKEVAIIQPSFWISRKSLSNYLVISYKIAPKVIYDFSGFCLFERKKQVQIKGTNSLEMLELKLFLGGGGGRGI